MTVSTDHAHKQHSSPSAAEAPPAGAPASELLKALLAPSSRDALAHARAAIATADDIPLYWTHVLQPALYEVGRLWETGAISVGQEHLATAIAQRLMSSFYPLILDRAAPRRGALVLIVSPGELHEVGPRMVADCLELDGWDVHFTGAATPADELEDMLRRTGAIVLGISTAMLDHVAKVRLLIADMRSRLGRPICVLVGGRAYAGARESWRSVGADCYAADATQATLILRNVVA